MECQVRRNATRLGTCFVSGDTISCCPTGQYEGSLDDLEEGENLAASNRTGARRAQRTNNDS